MDLLIEIRHNGTGGVSSAEAFVETATIGRSAATTFTQRFSYSHLWIDENITSADVERRSGNPGDELLLRFFALIDEAAKQGF